VILHLVTDRRRLCGSHDEVARSTCLIEQARFAVAAGLDVIQLREPDLDGGPLASLAKAIVALTRGSSTRVVVNDRLDVALATGADGVHLRGDSIDAVRVRSCAPAGFLVGRSIHSVLDLRDVGPVDYVIAGTVWATPSKPDEHALLGPEGLASIVAASPLPVLGIGGVGLERMPALAATGAAGLAAIGAFQGPECGCRAVPLHAVAQLLERAFVSASV
jgi:thiamine-phosphate pyrophosphorylase